MEEFPWINFSPADISVKYQSALLMCINNHSVQLKVFEAEHLKQNISSSFATYKRLGC